MNGHLGLVIGAPLPQGHSVQPRRSGISRRTDGKPTAHVRRADCLPMAKNKETGIGEGYWIFLHNNHVVLPRMIFQI